MCCGKALYLGEGSPPEDPTEKGHGNLLEVHIAGQGKEVWVGEESE